MNKQKIKGEGVILQEIKNFSDFLYNSLSHNEFWLNIYEMLFQTLI